jgi:hypothetical protein
MRKEQISRQLRSISHAQHCTGDCLGGRAHCAGIRSKGREEAVNAKWIDFFNKGDFAGVASLYTEDAPHFHRGPAW